MALTAEEEEAIMECDIEAAASGAAAGKRPAGAPPLGEPAPARARPPVDPHEDTLGGAATHTLPTPNTNHPPEEDASAESLFGQSTHPSEFDCEALAEHRDTWTLGEALAEHRVTRSTLGVRARH
ncbi:hypothetical protein AB1Y20_009402 [Prymnesium parvum]|uniref:Uncharacterized protein n=1 Tax=Prymnesium parvum TaxID=97485 RepID=A0AB34K0L5_PRYPA